MKWKILILFKTFVILMILSGCQRYLPKLETKAKTSMQHAQTVMAGSLVNEETPTLSVQYENKGNNVFVECIVTGITFRETDHLNRNAGKIVVWIDGKKNREVAAAAFIIKNLSSGNHSVKLEVVDLQNKSYRLSKEFMVNIPKS